MNRDELSASYARQIDALRGDDYETIEDELELGVGDLNNNRTSTLAFETWNATGDKSNSLFANLPGCEQCLTQAKLCPENLGRTGLALANSLNLFENELIPKSVQADWEPTRQVLEEFARLQLEARFPC